MMPNNPRSSFRPVSLALTMLLTVVFSTARCDARAGVVAAGDDHGLALHADGTVWAWGGNRYGQLGDGTTTDRDRAAPVLRADGTMLQRIEQVAAGYRFSLALDDMGQVWAWGRNDTGQLGAGAMTTSRGLADRVVLVDGTWLSDIRSIATGYHFGLGLRSDGTVWAWGRGDEGELGDGGGQHRPHAVQVRRQTDNEPLDEIVALSGGREHALALRSDGTVWAWGADGDGQLGDDGAIALLAPLAIQVHREGRLPLGGIRRIAAAGDYSLAIDRAGVLWAWGENRSATFGNDSTAGASQARAVDLPFDESISELAAGHAHVHARTSSGRGWSWGRNGSAQLGGRSRGTLSFSRVPVPMLGSDGEPLVGLRELTAGTWSGYALAADTAVLSWGEATDGQLGRPTLKPGDSEDHRPLPVLTVDDEPLFLETPEQDPILTVILVGDAPGRVTTTPVGIDCGPDCDEASYAFPRGAEVILTATDLPGSDFSGFAGDRCARLTPCTLIVDHDLVVRAEFVIEPPFELVSTTPADGRVGVRGDTPITLAFNRAVLPGPNVGAIRLLPAEGLPAAIDVTVDTEHPDRLTIVPRSPLDPATEYELQVPIGSAVDDEGASFRQPLTIHFSTRPAGPTRLNLALPHATVVEGATHNAWVFFDRPAAEDRTVHLYSDPADGVQVPATVAIAKGEIGSAFPLTANDVETSRIVSIEAAERSAGVATRELRVESLDPVPGSAFQFIGCRLVRDADRDHMVEAGEEVLFEVQVWNNSRSKLSSGRLCLEGIDFASEHMDQPGNDRCVFLPTLSPGVRFPTQFAFELSKQLMSSRYHFRIVGTSSLGGFEDSCAVDLVNEGHPDFYLSPRSPRPHPIFTEDPIHLVYKASSANDLFGDVPPTVRWWIEDATGTTVWERPTWADIWNEQVEAEFSAPSIPGDYAFFASINTPAALAETDLTNNLERPWRFTVRRRNVVPVPDPIETPLVVEVLEEIAIPIAFDDADGDDLTFALQEAPAGAVVEPTAPDRAIVRWTPTIDQGPDLGVPFTVGVDDGFGGFAEVSFVVDVSYSVDLQLSAKTLPAAVRGDTIRFTLVVHNASAPPIVGAGLIATTSIGFDTLRWTCSPDPGSGCTAIGAGPPIDGAIDLLGRASVTYSLDATLSAQAPETVHIEACVGSPPAPPIADPEPANNCLSLRIPVVDPGVDLRLRAVPSTLEIFPGDRRATDLVVESLGPSTAASIELFLDWPAALAGPTILGCSADSVESCRLDDLAPASSHTVRVEWMVDANTIPGDYRVAASAWSVTPETTPGDEALDVSVRVRDPSGLLHRDDFESEDLCLWSAVTPSPPEPCVDGSR